MTDAVDQNRSSEGFSYNSLELIRRRLLDLTNKNNILNFKHPKHSCVRLIDEQPDQIYQHLSDGGKFTFIPVPEPSQSELIKHEFIKFDKYQNKNITEFPTAEQWARCLDLSVSYELPTNLSINDERHTDSNLQTLLYETELESRLRKIRNAAATSIEESGSNILYLALGFLEWYESKDSEIARLAPLFTIPVTLERVDLKSGAYRYQIQIKDDGLITNVTLREKLSNDFGLSLPEIDEDNSPSSYFEEISKTILKYQPNWKIRRFGSLVMLNFTKQVMYEDLDPENWPEHLKIQDHPIIKNFFSGHSSQGELEGDYENSNDSAYHDNEYHIDQVESIHKLYPLIYDADSSQHSSIIDAVNGNNLVIEGPPGTGKSQTITNLIASTIANGKSVLFVAEKMAALNVVKNRLDKAGLGDFCLELHSHKTNKQKILQDLNRRLQSQSAYVNPKDIDSEISRYEDLKSQLNSYVGLINTNWGNTGLTIHEILNKATRLREELKLNPEQFFIENVDSKSLTSLKLNQFIDSVMILKSMYEQVSEQTQDGTIESHYWYGVNKLSATHSEIEEIRDRLDKWNLSIKKLKVEWVNQLIKLNVSNNKNISLNDIYEYKRSVESLPILLGGEQFDRIDYFYTNKDEIASLIDDYVSIHKEIETITPLIKPEFITNPKTPKFLLEVYEYCIGLGINLEKSIFEIENDIKKIREFMLDLENLKELFSKIKLNAPLEIQDLLENNISAYKEIKILINNIGNLPFELWKYRDQAYDNPELDGALDILIPEFSKLEPLYDQVKQEVKVESLPSSKTLKYYEFLLQNKSFFRWLSKEYRDARNAVLNLSNVSKFDKSKFLKSISKIVNYVEQYEKILLLHNSNPVLGELFKGPETPIKRISILRNWYRSIRAEYGTGFGKRVQIGSCILGLDGQFAKALADESNRTILITLDKGLNLINELSKDYKFHPLFKDESRSLDGVDSYLVKLNDDLTKLTVNLKLFIVNEEFTIKNTVLAHQKLTHVQRAIDKWNSSTHKNYIKPLGEILSVEPNNYSEKHEQIARNTVNVSVAVTDNPLIKLVINQDPSSYTYQLITDSLKSIEEYITEVIESQNKFVESSNANISQWLSATDQQLDLIEQRNNKALSNISWFSVWVEYNQIKNKLYINGLANIISKLEGLEVKPDKLDKVVSMSIYNQLAKEIIQTNKYLSAFAGIEQSAIQKRFTEYDRKLIDLQRKKVAFLASRINPPLGVSSGKVSQLTELSLINQEISKKKRHIAVRSLLIRAGTAIKTLKPCFMMSPMSVAQYLEPGRFQFDLVVMDEASQIKPEDALGAIARGAKLVVVGDPRQLPPTTFFNTVDNTDLEEDEAVTLQVTESILETVSSMSNFKRRILKWHYRSRHESLIAFSNKHFYDSKLIVFPSPFKDSNEFGVKLHFISNGRFSETGSESGGRNIEEATEVVKSIAKHLINNPKESLGVVAMNSKQKDEIEKQLDFLAKNDIKLYQAIQHNAASIEPLFIKNLENVQGDERDIIFISLTYGPNQTHGKVMQRFGPINQDVGWRRLNVLFTRSKKRMHIFSSMKSTDILISPTSSKGVLALKNFLEFAETGHLYSSKLTGKAPDSDFEISVMQELQKYGYECEPQLGVAGFYIDLAVKDPGNPGKFILGIECDGATYHSAKSARDRDRLRQEILEGLGWKIKRIWSTDWFKHPQSQLQPILNELQRLRSEVKAEDDTKVVEVFVPSIQSEQYEILTDLSKKDGLTLTEKLELFDKEVISQEFPKTDPLKKLLRREMIEQLVEKLPTSRAEFQEFIPRYLRTETMNYEAKYLDDVLKIIADS